MEQESENQIQRWLKKLEQESWQLELLVSAFTIFLLISAISSYSEFLSSFAYKYGLGNSILSLIYVFLLLLNLSIKVLTIFLIIHLLLRGFWIGAIGLRSVQSEIDYKQLNYNEFFTEKIKKRVVSLDNLVILLDEICSLIFSFAFLLISVLVSFGLFIVFIGSFSFIVGLIEGVVPDFANTIFRIIVITITFSILITGLIYFIDYFTLGFFKKIKWFSKVYYVIYRFYGVITLAVISRSIYYYLISKFSKKRIRIVYLVLVTFFMFILITEYDLHKYYPGSENRYILEHNYYDDERPEDDHIEIASVSSRIITEPYFQLFIRYDPDDNKGIESNCPELNPLKDEGLNWTIGISSTNRGISIGDRDFSEEDPKALLDCMSSFYRISINDVVYNTESFYFYEHPAKDQIGLMTMIPTKDLPRGELILSIETVSKSEEGETQQKELATFPVWVE